MAEKKGGKTVATVRALAEPLCKSLGLSLWDVRYEKEGATRYLRVLIDKDGGLDMDSCEEFSRQFNTVLDEADPISEPYVFEAGSPGLGRELRNVEHFNAFVGEKVKVGLFKAEDGKKEFVGTLVRYDEADKSVTLDCDGEKTFSVQSTAYIRAADDDLF